MFLQWWNTFHFYLRRQCFALSWSVLKEPSWELNFCNALIKFTWKRMSNCGKTSCCISSQCSPPYLLYWKRLWRLLPGRWSPFRIVNRQVHKNPIKIPQASNPTFYRPGVGSSNPHPMAQKQRTGRNTSRVFSTDCPCR